MSRRLTRLGGLHSPDRARRFETLAVLAALTVAAVALDADVLRPRVLSGDALVHQYWMWQFRDPELFTDGLTADLRESSRYPFLYQALFWLPSQVADPVAFGEWVGVALMVASGWLVFGIVREHASWRAAPWVAAGAFMALADIHRFSGARRARLAARPPGATCASCEPRSLRCRWSRSAPTPSRRRSSSSSTSRTATRSRSPASA